MFYTCIFWLADGWKCQIGSTTLQFALATLLFAPAVCQIGLTTSLFAQATLQIAQARLQFALATLQIAPATLLFALTRLQIAAPPVLFALTGHRSLHQMRFLASMNLRIHTLTRVKDSSGKPRSFSRRACSG